MEDAREYGVFNSLSGNRITEGLLTYDEAAEIVDNDYYPDHLYISKYKMGRWTKQNERW